MIVEIDEVQHYVTFSPLFNGILHSEHRGQVHLSATAAVWQTGALTSSEIRDNRCLDVLLTFCYISRLTSTDLVIVGRNSVISISDEEVIKYRALRELCVPLQDIMMTWWWCLGFSHDFFSFSMFYPLGSIKDMNFCSPPSSLCTY